MRTLLAVSAALCAWTQPAPRPDVNLNAVLWVQSSAEYAASAMQTYRGAELALSAALADPNWTAAYEQTNAFQNLPPAVILDLDETVLDNSSFQAALSRSGATYTDEAWQVWVKSAKAGAVPGAVEFLHAAVLKGVAPIYISNRRCDPGNPEDGTIKALIANRIPYAADRLLCRTGPGDKADRRKLAASRYRILLLIGDDFGDFTTPPDTVAARDELRRFHNRMWGSRWFVLPNPTYGSWERAIGLGLPEKWKALR